VSLALVVVLMATTQEWAGGAGKRTNSNVVTRFKLWVRGCSIQALFQVLSELYFFRYGFASCFDQAGV